jgi:tetratricopeptide (TPR) repeat protein
MWNRLFGNPRVPGPALPWLLLALLPGAARAQGTAELRQGIEAYENFEYPEAQKLLEQAAGRTDLPRADQARARLYLGLVAFTLGDRVRAEAAFKAALEIDRELQLPADTSPKIAEVFEALRAKLPRQVVRPEPDPGPGPGVGGEAPPPPGPRERVWTWVLAGLGGAALAAGGTCGYLAYASEQDSQKAVWASDAASHHDKAETRALAANVLYGLGGAALVGALILFFVEVPGDGPDSAAEEVEIGLRLEPALGGAVLRW